MYLQSKYFVQIKYLVRLFPLGFLSGCLRYVCYESMHGGLLGNHLVGSSVGFLSFLDRINYDYCDNIGLAKISP